MLSEAFLYTRDSSASRSVSCQMQFSESTTCTSFVAPLSLISNHLHYVHANNISTTHLITRKKSDGDLSVWTNTKRRQLQLYYTPSDGIQSMTQRLELE
jgi:hypothetical protein